MQALQVFRRLLKLAPVLTVAVAIGAAATAGVLMDEITLPSTVVWGSAVLSPGDYTLIVPSRDNPQTVYLVGGGKVTGIKAVRTGFARESDRGELDLVEEHGSFHVRALVAPELGVILYYDVPSERRGAEEPARGAEPDLVVVLPPLAERPAAAVVGDDEIVSDPAPIVRR